MDLKTGEVMFMGTKSQKTKSKCSIFLVGFILMISGKSSAKFFSAIFAPAFGPALVRGPWDGTVGPRTVLVLARPMES